MSFIGKLFLLAAIPVIVFSQTNVDRLVKALDSLMLSSFDKRAEDGNGWIVHWYDAEGEGSDEVETFHRRLNTNRSSVVPLKVIC